MSGCLQCSRIASVILAAAFRRLQANKSEFLPLNRSVPLLVLIGLESIHRVVQ
jgi:hypothetical protein